MKCLKYWPDDQKTIGNIDIYFQSQEENEVYTVRQFTIKKVNVKLYPFFNGRNCGKNAAFILILRVAKMLSIMKNFRKLENDHKSSKIQNIK